MIGLPPSEHDLHAYVDHRLDAASRRQLEIWLAAHPDVAAQVSAWQQDAQALRIALGSVPLAANPALDPTALRGQRKRRQQRHWAQAAGLLLALGMGALGGWQARDWSSASQPMGDALQAYRLFALQGVLPADLKASGTPQFQGWLDQRFKRAERLPDFQGAGFEPVAARLINTEQGPAAMVLYRANDGRQISFYIRPPGPNARLLPRGNRRDGELQADYWSGPGYNYAMVSASNEPSSAQLIQALGI
ncbi:anti-sigma factor family protein [Pseudomonas sp. nanlin1]|uniref:anti-sigma factor family protein n=1 Tax=Pseudomonas sp. nanlin1 TaxID=3040605 RepID=UPI00388D3E8B